MTDHIWIFESSSCPPEGIDSYRLFKSREGALACLEESVKEQDSFNLELLQSNEYSEERKKCLRDELCTLVEVTEDRVEYKYGVMGYMLIKKQELEP